MKNTSYFLDILLFSALRTILATVHAASALLFIFQNKLKLQPNRISVF